MNSKYKNWKTEDYIAYIEKLEEKIKSKDQEQIINFKWAGNLGQWTWFYKENRVIFNDLKVQSLGYEPENIGEVGFQFFTNKLHPDDYEKVMNDMKQHLIGKTDAYEVEYRIRHRDGHYLWYYDRGVVTKRETDGRPIMLEGIVFDISESKRIEEKLTFYAEKDVLTQVMNRRMLYKYLSKSIKSYENDKETFSLIMIDIDHFKKINDKYGHLVGDETLVSLIKTINEEKRSKDLVFRYGGDEFFLLLPKTQLEGAIEFGKRMHNTIENLQLPKVSKITVSMGIVEYQAYEQVDDIIKRVDDLMYEAKEKGRNQFIF